MKRAKAIIAAAVGVAALSVADAQAQSVGDDGPFMVVRDWNLDLNAVNSDLTGVIEDITTFDLQGDASRARAQFVDINTNGTIDVGDQYRIVGIARFDAFTANDGASSTIPPDLRLGSDTGCGIGSNCWEATAVFDVNVEITSLLPADITTAPPGLIEWTNVAGGNLDNGDGLQIFIDHLDSDDNDGGEVSNINSGDGYDDGTLLAGFQLRSGDGGGLQLSSVTGNLGNTNSFFELSTAAAAGAIEDSGGNDIGQLIGELIAFLNEPLNASNFDIPQVTSTDSPLRDRFATDDPLDLCDTVDLGDDLEGDTGCLIDFYLDLDPVGDLRLPEPATLGIMGMGLLGLGVALRRRRKAAA